MRSATAEERRLKEMVENGTYTLDEWNQNSLYRYVNYLNKSCKVKDLLLK